MSECENEGEKNIGHKREFAKEREQKSEIEIESESESESE